MRLVPVPVLVPVLVLVLGGCGGGEPAKNPNDTKPAAGAAPAITQFEKRADKADMIGGSDGSFKPDGHPDQAFDAAFHGPIVSLVILSVNDNAYQWDTYTGLQTIPASMHALVPKGHQTGGIGVYEAGKLLNNPDGSFAMTDDKEHHVVIYLSDNGAFQPGASFKLLAETPDHKIVEGPVTKF